MESGRPRVSKGDEVETLSRVRKRGAACIKVGRRQDNEGEQSTGSKERNYCLSSNGRGPEVFRGTGGPSSDGGIGEGRACRHIHKTCRAVKGV